MELVTGNRTRKRTSPCQDRQEKSEQLCSICEKKPSALLVSVPSVRNKRPIQTHYCLLHYYTTSAAQSKPEDVSVINQEQLEEQLPAMQSLFADVFVELKQELSEEAARQFQATARDPLAIIGKLHKSNKKRERPPRVRPQADTTGGGFMEHVPLPERLVRTQHEQAQKQMALVRRMEQASKTPTTNTTIAASGSHTQRRKPTRKSIWSVMEDAAYKPAVATATTTAAKDTTPSFLDSNTGVTCSSCGSTNVSCLSSSMNRNNESTKGEIWGSGSRDDVTMRYQCQACGRTWNEQE